MNETEKRFSFTRAASITGGRAQEQCPTRLLDTLMNKSLRIAVVGAFCAAVAILLPGCGGPTSTTFVAAPPGPADLGPATGLSTPPPDVAVFDLKYRAETGGPDDISYRSFWGYGGSLAESRTNSFLEDVRKKASRLAYEYNRALTGREWAAVEYDGSQARALFFDLDADGKFSENERIPPTRGADRGVQFITPDFEQPVEGGGQTLCRVLLQVDFYAGRSEPNCMWSPAALLEGAATLNGQPARLLLYASNPGGGFDRFGRSRFSLLLGDRAQPEPGRYLPREALSSLIANNGQFYHLTLEGRYSNGLPARVLLARDTTPTGSLAVKLVGSNALQATFSSLYLQGAEDKTIFLRLSTSKEELTLPAGAYVLDSGAVSYGGSNRQDWEVSFTGGPRATVKAGQVAEQALGQPTLRVRAVNERQRYNSRATESATFKKGTRIYLEPRIVGQGGEVFGRFQQGTAARGRKTDRPPRITIADPDGKELLSKTMQYG